MMDRWTRLALLTVLVSATFALGCKLYGRVLTIESQMKELRNHGPVAPLERARAGIPPEAGAGGEESAELEARLAALESDVSALEAELRAGWDRALKAPAQAGGAAERLAVLEKKIATTTSAPAHGDGIARTIQEGRLRVYRRYVEGQLAHLASTWKERLTLTGGQADLLDRLVAEVVEEAMGRAGQRQLSELPFNGWNDEEAGLAKALGERLGPSLTMEQRRGLEALVKIPARQLAPAAQGR